jgi:hypothetical protein
VRLLQIYIAFVSLATCCTVHFAGTLNNRLLLIRVRTRPRRWSFPNCYVRKPELYRKLRNKEILNILIKMTITMVMYLNTERNMGLWSQGVIRVPVSLKLFGMSTNSTISLAYIHSFHYEALQG